MDVEEFEAEQKRPKSTEQEPEEQAEPLMKKSSRRGPDELIKELSTPNDSSNGQDQENVIPPTARSKIRGDRLAEHFNRVCSAEGRAFREVLQNWYWYGKELQENVDAVISAYKQKKNQNLSELAARTHVNNILKKKLPGVKSVTLRQKNQKGRKIYKLFRGVGIDKIQRVQTFTADAISRFAVEDIDYVIEHVRTVSAANA